MASAKPSTSLSAEQTRVKINKETMRILRRVYQKLDQERKGQFPLAALQNNMERAARYTGLHINVLERLKDNDIVMIDIETIDRSVIHNEILNFYLHDQKLPTTGELFNALYGKIPPFVDIKMLRKLLVKMDYIWKLIPNYTLVIIENPKVTFERYFYLKNMTQYREEKRTIYFVVENILREHPKHAGGFFSLNEGVKLASEDIFDYVTYAISGNGVHFLKTSRDFEEDVFEDWVNEFLAKLPSPSVIVLQNSEYNNRELIAVPNQNSLRIDMQEWLDYHNIPYSVDMSKVELYSLIENYTDTSKKLYKVDSILELCGHVVLRLPHTIDQMTPGRLMLDLIKKNFSAARKIEDWQGYLKSLMYSIPEDTIKNISDFIAAEEREMFRDDKKVDQIFESLVKKMESFACDEQGEDSDLPTFSDSE